MDPLAPQDPLSSQLRARRRADRQPDRRAPRRLGRHRLPLDRNRPARRPPRTRQPALHPIRSRRRAGVPQAGRELGFTYPPKPKSGLQEVQFDATVPTTADRVAQTAVAMRLEEKLEPIFHPDSYGYRPGRSAHDALAVTRRRCWKQDWLLDLDIRSFFDSVPHDLLMKAVAHHTQLRLPGLYLSGT